MVVCDDVVPLPRVDGFRTRTGKTVSALTAASGGDAIAFTDGFLSAWSLSGVQAGVIATKYLAQTDSSSIANTRFVSGSAGSVYVLSSQAANYAGAALTLTGRINRFRSNDNGSAVLMRSELWIPSLDYAAMRYGGAVDDSNVPYSTGTVSGTIATTTLTFGGGANVSTIPIGSYIVINNASLQERPYRVASINSATSITVDRPLAATVAGVAYRITANAGWFCKPGTFGARNQASITAYSTVVARGAAFHQGRVIAWGTIDADGIERVDRWRWSASAKETDGGHWGGCEYFHSNAFSDLDVSGSSGTDSSGYIAHGVSWKGSFYFFRNDGLYVLRGYLETDGRDAGASVDYIGSYPSLFTTVPPVVTSEGIWFLCSEGLMLWNGYMIRNFTRESGAFRMWELMNNIQDYRFRLSVLSDRIIIQSGENLQDSASTLIPNTMVYWRHEQLWTTQTTVACTNIVDTGDSEVALPNRPEVAALAISPSWTNWQADTVVSSSPVAEGGRYPLMNLVTHPVALSRRDVVNGRVRGVHVRAKILDSVLATDPTLGVSVLLGEEGYNTAVEPAISGSISVAESTVTEKWNRIPVRAGSPPVDSVRVRLLQSGGSHDLRVTDVGVEYAAVDRIRV